MRIPIDQRKPAPGIRATLLFRGKVLVLQARRAARESKRSGVKRHDTGSTLIDKPVIAQSRTPVWTPHEAAENALVAGRFRIFVWPFAGSTESRCPRMLCSAFGNRSDGPTG